ncbi:winged helix DNA-binding domain-containing protein [Catellatospora sp. NPDC049609]|uniref:winged helix DNA-binding domain-containing protein n=1 Tax=Catellatospora sp. NPDC049609 TaxID=3155505 RepID=UPI00341E5C5F
MPDNPRDDAVPDRLLRARAQAIGGGVRLGSAAAVVERVFAVQAQDATAAELGVRARSRGLTAEDVRRAYEDDRSILRGWFMRGTLHTIPGSDARWVLRLLGPRVIAATASRYRQLGLDDDLRERADRHLARALSAHGPLTRAELAEHLAKLGVDPAGQAPYHLIRHATLSGLACHGPRRAGETTYVLLDDWLPERGGEQPSPQDAAAELARRYLRAYAPAGVADFATWSGLPVTAARRAWAQQAGLRVRPDGSAVLDEAAGEVPGADAADVRLLPAYDDYLTGYRSRDAVVDTAYQQRVFPGGGVIRPAVAVDGLAVGTWARHGARGVRVDAFAALPPEVQAGIEAEAADVTRFLRTLPPAALAVGRDPAAS